MFNILFARNPSFKGNSEKSHINLFPMMIYSNLRLCRPAKLRGNFRFSSILDSFSSPMCGYDDFELLIASVRSVVEYRILPATVQ